VSSKKLLLQTAPIDLNEFKAMRAQAEPAVPGLTLNDVFVGLVTAALRQLYEEHRDPAKHVRAGMPISMRANAQGGLSNRFAIALFPIDFRYKDYVDLLKRVKRAGDAIKVSPAAALGERAAKSLIKIMPKSAFLSVVVRTVNLSTLVISNVLGPSTAVSLAGQVVKDIHFSVHSPTGLYLGLFTYNGQFVVSINVDESLGVDPADIARCLREQFALMKAFFVPRVSVT